MYFVRFKYIKCKIYIFKCFLKYIKKNKKNCQYIGRKYLCKSILKMYVDKYVYIIFFTFFAYLYIFVYFEISKMYL